MKISVAMTTYNGASYLRQQLESISAQARLPDEIVVCDDGSTDGTPELLREYLERAPFAVRIVSNESRLGSTKNFEQAILLCSGDIIALCDQDDIWRPRKLASIERRFERNPDVGLVFTNGDLIDGDGALMRGDLWSKFGFHPRLRNLLNSRPGAYDLLLSRFFVTGATVAFRSKFRNLCLPIPDGTPTFIHDRWIAVMVGAVALVDAIDEKLIAYRLHPQQQMGVGKRSLLSRYLAPYDCSSDRAALAIMRDRLANVVPNPAHPQFLSALDVRQQHLAVRFAFSNRLMRRLVDVISECLSKRYQRYPLGRGYAVKDLLVGTR